MDICECHHSEAVMTEPTGCRCPTLVAEIRSDSLLLGQQELQVLQDI